MVNYLEICRVCTIGPTISMYIVEGCQAIAEEYQFSGVV